MNVLTAVISQWIVIDCDKVNIFSLLLDIGRFDA